MTKERWKAVRNFEGEYEVSDHGRVRTVAHTVIRPNGSRYPVKSRLRKQKTTHTGHKSVILRKPGRTQVTRRVHTLVLEAFVSPRPDGMECCHNDGNPANNRLENLRWDTRSQNRYDSVKHGTHPNASKSHCPRGHLLKAPNLVASVLRSRNKRACLACYRAKDRIRRGRSSESDFIQLSDLKYREIMTAAEETAA